MPEIYSPPCKLHESILFLTKCIGDAIHLGNATTLYVRRMSTDFHWNSDIGKCMARRNNWTRKIINLASLPILHNFIYSNMRVSFMLIVDFGLS